MPSGVAIARSSSFSKSRDNWLAVLHYAFSFGDESFFAVLALRIWLSRSRG
jgi:hypothetical protein